MHSETDADWAGALFNGLSGKPFNAANAALDDLREAKAQTLVNWADIRCSAVRLVREYTGPNFHDSTTTWEAVFSEADPDAAEFREAIRLDLLKRYFYNVNIVTEW